MRGKQDIYELVGNSKIWEIFYINLVDSYKEISLLFFKLYINI